MVTLAVAVLGSFGEVAGLRLVPEEFSGEIALSDCVGVDVPAGLVLRPERRGGVVWIGRRSGPDEEEEDSQLKMEIAWMFKDRRCYAAEIEWERERSGSASQWLQLLPWNVVRVSWRSSHLVFRVFLVREQREVEGRRSDCSVVEMLEGATDSLEINPFAVDLEELLRELEWSTERVERIEKRERVEKIYDSVEEIATLDPDNEVEQEDIRIQESCQNSASSSPTAMISSATFGYSQIRTDGQRAELTSRKPFIPDSEAFPHSLIDEEEEEEIRGTPPDEIESSMALQDVMQNLTSNHGKVSREENPRSEAFKSEDRNTESIPIEHGTLAKKEKKKTLGGKKRKTPAANRESEEEDHSERLMTPSSIKEEVTSKMANSSLAAADDASSKRQKSRSLSMPEISNPSVLFSKVDDGSVKDIVKRLKGTIAKSVADCTCLVVDKFRRTEKFFSALVSGKPIVHIRWLLESKQAKRFLPLDSYILEDRPSEEKYAFSLRESLSAIQQRGDGRIFSGKRIFLSPECDPPRDVLKEFVSLSGAQLLSRAPSKPSPYTLILASPDESSVSSLLSRNLSVFSPELLFASLLRQRLDLSSEFRLPLTSKHGP